MTEPKNPKMKPDLPSSEPPPPQGQVSSNAFSQSARKARYVNPPETVNPDPATLRDQWRFAVREYSKWYSHAWGTAILAGAAFFALGWLVKGGNPLPQLISPKPDADDEKPPSPSDR